MLDAQSDNPVCGDDFAARFMDANAMRVFNAFLPFERPNASNVARHRIIDDLLRDRLAERPDSQIFLVGCGFDSRAYRLNGGTWVEVDEDPLIAEKNRRLPVSECPSRLHRLAIDFSSESLADKLAEFATQRPVCIVVEGVFMYLSDDQIKRLLDALRHLFPQHELLCDLMSARFFEKYSRPVHAQIQALGANFQVTRAQPHRLFLEHGYTPGNPISIVGRAIELGSVRIPRLVFRWFLPTLAHGYAVNAFSYGSSPISGARP